MMIKDTPRDELVGTFGEVVGVEKAEAMLADAAAELGLEDEAILSAEDVIDVCDVIEEREEGYVSMLAADLKVQKQSERRFNALLENIPDPTVVVRFEDGVPIIKTVNTAFETVFGYGLAEVTGEALPTVILPDELHDRGHKLDPQQLAADRIEREVRRETSDGEVRTFLVRSMPVSTMAGEPEAAIILTDITEQKRRQRELKRRNEQLEQFASVVSHDLRNPLTVATGRLPVIRDAVDGEAEHVDAVADALDRMERLIDDVLTLAREGQTIGETEPVSLAARAEAAWENVDAPDAALRVDDDLPTVAADPHRLQEAFENLFRNAIEHGGADVDVWVGRTDGGFYVADDGAGIPPEERPDVFDQGYTTDPDGTGFGLSIVENIVEAHGWSIDVAGSEEGGARFDVLVPELDAEAAAPAE